MKLYIELVRFSPDRLWITTTDGGFLPMPQLTDMHFHWHLFTVIFEWRPF